MSNGTNTFTAVGYGTLNRADTNIVTAFLPTSLTLAYDANGNLIYDGVKALEYDDENQLIRLTATNLWKSEFTYDGKMRRRLRREYGWENNAWVQTNEVRYIYDGNLVVEERDRFNLPVVVYTRGQDLSGGREGAGGIGGLLGRTTPSGSTSESAFYHSDSGGNVTLLVNSYEQAVARYVYDPFGGVISRSGPLCEANIYGFASKEADRKSGLVYFLYRYYDPHWQRWQNFDPIGDIGSLAFYSVDAAFPLVPVELWQDANLYSYVKNIPLLLVDFFGLALTDQQVANILFNETRSLSGPGIDRCRCNLAHAIKNGDAQADQGKIGKRPKTGPTTAKVPDVEKDTYQKCMDAVQQCNREKKSGNDPTKGSIHFNFRNNNSRAPFQGNEITTQCGPFNNSHPAKKGQPGLQATGIYGNTYK